MTIVSLESAPVTQGQRPFSRQVPFLRAATSAGVPRWRRLVESCEMPTVVGVSPRARAGSRADRRAGSPPAMIRQALAHWVRASAVVRQRPAIAASISRIKGSAAAVPPQSAGMNPASAPDRASDIKAPLCQGPISAVSCARPANASQSDESATGSG